MISRKRPDCLKLPGGQSSRRNKKGPGELAKADTLRGGCNVLLEGPILAPNKLSRRKYDKNDCTAIMAPIKA